MMICYVLKPLKLGIAPKNPYGMGHGKRKIRDFRKVSHLLLNLLRQILTELLVIVKKFLFRIVTRSYVRPSENHFSYFQPYGFS